MANIFSAKFFRLLSFLWYTRGNCRLFGVRFCVCFLVFGVGFLVCCFGLVSECPSFVPFFSVYYACDRGGLYLIRVRSVVF